MRTYVRGLTSDRYSLKEEISRLKAMPRVIKGKDIPWKGGAEGWRKVYIEPETSPGQTMYVFVTSHPPGSHGKKHGHQNEALFYILDGKGYSIHDEERYDWQAGDVLIVHNNRVGHSFNDPDKPSRILVINPKPLWMFLNLLDQEEVEPPPKTPGQEGFRPED